MPDSFAARVAPLNISAELELSPGVVTALRGSVSDAAEATIAAVTAEVPGYRGALSDRERDKLSRAVELALRGLVNAATRARPAGDGSALTPALDAAYDLGRGEARAGRTLDALLGAYRVGARVSWRELGGAAVAHGLGSEQVAALAELVFAYIDELSAASLAGHSDELARAGRDLARNLEQLGRDLLSGATAEKVLALAAATMWTVPERMVAVILPTGHVHTARARLDLATLEVTGEIPGIPLPEAMTVLLAPVSERNTRSRLLGLLAGQTAVLGPDRPWLAVRSSAIRAARTLALGVSEGLVDSEAHLARLAVTADPEVLGDLRERAMEPMAHLRPAVAQRLAETLGAWLRHQGRRDDVAAELFVHPQTVRYRMGQLRELYGSRLVEPQSVMELTIALAVVPIGNPVGNPVGPGSAVAERG